MLKGVLSGVVSGRAFQITTGRERQQLLTTFWVGIYATFFILPFVVSDLPPELYFGGIGILVTAALPTFLWCRFKVPGVPIFPVYALTFIWTCGIPVLASNASIDDYSPSEQFSACMIVAVHLAVGTAVWFLVTSRKSSVPSMVRTLDGHRADSFLLYAFATSVVFTLGVMANWFGFVDVGLFALVRGMLLGLNSLATFVLSYRYGTRELPRQRAIVFLIWFVLYIVANIVSILLIGALSLLVVAAIGYSIGRGRVPLVPFLLALCVLVPLHYGERDMRTKYWRDDQPFSIQPWEYPRLFVEWAGYSYEAINYPDDDRERPQTILERAGNIQLLLTAQRAFSEGVPPMNGQTYAIVPRLLIPRILDPDKPASHEGNYQLNIYFERQTREDTALTTIGWGLLNESYANFGWLGIIALGAFMGTLYGSVARWSANCPIVSARFLCSLLLLTFAIQSEYSASVYVSALFQSVVSLGAVVFLFMTTRSQSGSVEQNENQLPGLTPAGVTG